MRTVILMTCLLAGCVGDITNGIFDEDKVFLSAFPSSERTRIEVDDGTGSTTRRSSVDDPCSVDSYNLTGKPDLLVLTITTAVGVNCGVAGQLATIDYIRTLPPTARTTDSRTWGPYEMETDVWIRADIERSGGTYTWAISGSDSRGGPWTDWFTGEHLAGETVAKGLGEMELDYGDIASITGADWTGSARASYDLREDRELYVFFDDMQIDDMSRALSADYWFKEAPEADDFEFRTEADFVGEDALDEQLEVRTRWIPGEGGRSDAWLTGGTIDGYDVRVTQCWGPWGTLVYQEDSNGWIPEVGASGECAFSTVAELEHI